ncbi:hypothetical protein PS2_002985 [Malus domestica]
MVSPKRTISCYGVERARDMVDPSRDVTNCSLASGSVRTPKLSEKEARALPGWVTHWEVAREFPKTKP